MFTEVSNVWEKEGRSPEEAQNLQIRALLMAELRQIIFTSGWNQTEAARLLGIAQPRVSYLVTGQVSKFTIEKLFGYLSRLGYDYSVSLQDGHPEIEVKRAA